MRMRGTDLGGGFVASEPEPLEGRAYDSLRDMVDDNDNGVSNHYMLAMRGDEFDAEYDVIIEGRLPLGNLSFTEIK